MFFRNKEEKVIELMGKHFDLIEENLKLFNDFITAYCDGADEARLKELSFQVHKKEHEADDARREIQRKLCEGAFLPFYRENFTKIPDFVDKVPGLSVKVCKEIFLRQINMPNEIKIYLKQLTEAVLETYNKFLEIFEYIPNDFKRIMALAEEVSKYEQKVDKIEWAAKVYLYKTNNTLDKVDKLIIEELITIISGIADAIENVADYIEITMIKMKV